MRRTAAILLLGFGAAALAAAAQAPLSPRDSALHVLNRLAYGPRPGDVDRVAAMGVMAWIERQLVPERIDDSRLADLERRFELLELDPDDLGQLYAAAQQERRRAMARGDTVAARKARQVRRGRRLAGEFQQLAVVRAVVSERQLREVMADFWTNHFNVFSAKGLDRLVAPDYIERTIRPLALGRFEDLLIATAKSPAMLVYLDNAQSVAPGSSTRGRNPRGLNENYARELLELHTLGVDGGYTQDDVVAVARIFTGWSVERPNRGLGFVFRARAHDRGEKGVLGRTFPAGRGMDEGVDLLKLLAGHHATMHHVSGKLCARFVADDPPDGCVDAAVEAWHRSGGDIRAVLRAIFRSPDFWATRHVRAKVKTPLEFVASAVRAVGGAPDSTLRLAQVVARLGQPLFLQPVPTGYPEAQQDWVSSGALLNRMNVAVAIAAGRLPGIVVNLDSILPAETERGELAELVDRHITGGILSARTKSIIQRETADVRDPAYARAFAVGLALGGPEFQRQ